MIGVKGKARPPHPSDPNPDGQELVPTVTFTIGPATIELSAGEAKQFAIMTLETVNTTEWRCALANAMLADGREEADVQALLDQSQRHFNRAQGNYQRTLV